MSTSINITDAFNGQTPSIYLEDNGDYLISGMVYDEFSRDDVFILKMTNSYQISGLDSSFVPYVNERDISTSTSNGVYGDQTVFISSAGGVLFDELFQINDPAGLMIDSNDNVFVTDFNDTGHLIQQFDAAGNFIRNWGSTGTGDGQFDYPVDIARDNAGDIYVADAGNYRIQKFSPDGTYISAWGSATFEGGELSNIKGMTIDSDDNMYIAQAGEIKKFQTDGTLLDTWTGFTNVYGVATDSSNNVYIVDSGLSRVYKYSSEGTYLDEWGSSGSSTGQFSNPYGIGVDGSDYIYVADSANNRIQKFDSSGNFQMQISGAGSEDGAFDTPVDVEINGNGDIYVLEAGYNNRVQKFDSSGTFIHNWGHEVIRDIDPLAELLVDMRGDRDWSSVTKGISRDDGKSFIHGLPTSEGTYMPFSLFVPKLTDSEGVHVCPGVDSLGNITDECSAGYEVLDGDVRISTITYNGRDYWKVTGVAGSGGMNILAQANTGGDDPVEDPTEDPTEDPGTDPTSEQTDNSDDNSDVELTEAGQPVVLVIIGAAAVFLITVAFYLYKKGILKKFKSSKLRI
jgi:streptogramin lyase